jgi:transcription antitermination factor NusG
MRKLADNAELVAMSERLAAKQRRVIIPASFADDIPPRWYCVYTAQWSEKLAEREIEALGLEPYLPKETRWDRHQKNGRRSKTFNKVMRALIPRYMFVSIRPGALTEARDAIEACRSVEEVVCCRASPGVPLRIPDDVIHKLRSREQAGEFDETLEVDEQCPYQLGEQVRINDGVFAGLTVEFGKMRPNRRAEVFVAMLGAVSPVDLPLAWLEKL